MVCGGWLSEDVEGGIGGIAGCIGWGFVVAVGGGFVGGVAMMGMGVHGLWAGDFGERTRTGSDGAGHGLEAGGDLGGFDENRR